MTRETHNLSLEIRLIEFIVIAKDHRTSMFRFKSALILKSDESFVSLSFNRLLFHTNSRCWILYYRQFLSHLASLFSRTAVHSRIAPCQAIALDYKMAGQPEIPMVNNKAHRDSQEALSVRELT